MGFTENYLALWEKDKKGSNIQKTTKKKKKKETTGDSFTDNYLSLMEEEEDIAPVAVSSPLFVNKTAPLFNNDGVTPLGVAPFGSKTLSNGMTVSSGLHPLKEEEKDERKWFEKGAFEDGYQFGDVIKTILGTTSDLTTNIGAGALGIIEPVIDAGATVVGGVGGMLGFDEFKQDTADFIKKDIIDEKKWGEILSSTAWMKPILESMGTNADDASLMGDRTDSLVQSGGQWASTVALQSVGVPWQVTSGVTSFGGESENALKEGATYSEAVTSGLVSAGGEILGEYLLGGMFGETGLDDVLIKRFTRDISDKTLRGVLKYAVKSGGEGLVEEPFSWAISKIGQKLTYLDEKSWKELFTSDEAKEELVDSIVGGLFLGGVIQGVDAVTSKSNGVDYTTGLTSNEEQVVRKAYESEVAEREKNGKITDKEKNQIWDNVVRDMDRGYISTDTIEEVLGGDTYTMHRDTIAREQELQSEYDALYKMKNGDKSDEQIDRQAELKQQLEDIKQNFNRNQLGDEVMSLVKGSRLAESYNERARRGQAYEADLTKYTPKQQATIQKAIDSGILNNTNRTHEFVNMVAKITADKGVSFDFTNNEKLKESGFAVAGKVVNGFVTKDGISLNIDSAKALNSVVGHEITHVLEGTELYNVLQNTVLEYAKSKGDYQGRYDSLSELYKDIEGADIDAEMTADLVGDYLFTDRDFIRNLSVTNKNVFQKVWDEIKYLYKVATAGSNEARELEKLKKAFEDAYREGGKKQSETKYSISDKNIKDISTGYGYGETYYTMSYTQDGKTVATLEYGEYDGEPNVKMIEVEPEYRRKGIATKLLQELQQKYPDAEINFGMTTPDGTKLLESITYDVTDEAVVADRQKLKDLQTELNELQEKLDVLYDTDNLTEEQDAELHRLGDRWQEVYETIHELSESLRGKTATKTYVKYSISDSDYADAVSRNDMETAQRMVDEAAEAAMPNSKIRGKDGKLMPVYHGTNDTFYKFDSSIKGGVNGTAEGFGIYTSDKPEVTEAYGDRQIKMYANITKPAASDKKTISAATLAKLIKDTCKKQAQKMVDDGEYDSVREAIMDTWVSNYVYTYDIGMERAYREVANSILQMNDSDMAIIQEVMSGLAIRDYAEANEFYRESLTPVTGFDGFVTQWENSNTGEKSNIILALNSAQLKSADPVTYDDNGNAIPLTERFNLENEDIRYSLSAEGEAPVRRAFNTYGEDIALETQLNSENANLTAESEVPVAESQVFPDDIAPMPEDEETAQARLASLTDADAPAETEAPYTEDEDVTVDDPFEERDWYEVGNRKVKAYMYENPEVKPFFQEEAANLLGELQNTIKGEKWYNAQMDYDYGTEAAWGGTKRFTSESIAEMLDGWGMSYADIEKGLNAIIEDNGAENIAAAKKIEFMLNERLLNGYKDFYSNGKIPPNEEYLNLLHEKEITEYSKEAFDRFMETADAYAPAEVAEEDIAPVVEKPAKESYEAIRPKQEKEPRMAKATPAEQARAEILVDEPKVDKKKSGVMSKIRNLVLDKGMVFEDLSLKTGNRELQARWDSIRRAEGRAQRFMESGNAMSNSLKSIRETVEKTGKTKQFYEYLYHLHNVDRMSLEGRYEDTPNKPVFGNSVTAEVSQEAANKLEKANPEFKQYAQEVYKYMTSLREMLVDGGVISGETAKLWQEMYPHYVPIRRVGDEGLNINVPLDSRRTGVNAPVKRATGGSRDILPLFDTMGQRTLQTFKAIAKNRFGVELKNTLGTTIDSDALSLDEAIDSMDAQDLLQEGKDGRSPTFTVFENGEKVTFEITEEMYDAMKPKSDALAYTNKFLNTASNVRRGVITEYNPWFLLKNAVKDTQDILINSQHAVKTYAAIPKAIEQMASKGHWYQEYLDNGGDQDTYFDSETNTVKETNKTAELLKKITGLDAISKANNVIERLPRLAEYIASREAGRSVDVSMLDAARVTTNFAAGGDLTKFLNRNGATFLNASVQGAMQNVRNVREAKMNGLKGWASLAGKFVVAGLPAVILNNFIWDDDEEYDELSDYVKQNYYIVGKYGDGKFVRIPKGRTVAVIQNAIEQVSNAVTGNDEADLGSFIELVISNLAPNNPIDNNILSPIIQVANNETWYGEDLVPTRLQDLPSAEQYDETTDSISKWLGENFDPLKLGAYRINYLLDQYSGVLGDTFLPMLTPEAESGDDSFIGNMIAPLKDMFTTDSVLKNQNVSDFYDLKDELAVNANASGATDEDKLMSKYMNSVNAAMAKLYAQKREIQNSDMSDSEKYAAVRDIQKQIVELTKEGMNTYSDISFEDDYREGGEYARVGDRLYKLNDEGEWQKLSDEQFTKYEVTKAAGDSSYATDGTNHYRWYEPGEDASEGTEAGWRKVTEKELERQDEVTSGLGITAEEYWSNKEEYSYAYDHPENYSVAKAVGGYEAYRNYSSELYDIKADKDENGKSISGSRKEKVLDYINNLDADYYTKIILWKSEYTSDDTYNYEIIDYLNGRDDISYEDMVSILRKLGFNVTDDGNITW